MGTRPAPSRQVTPEQLSCVHSTRRQERSKGCNGEMPSGGAPPGAHCQPPLHPKSPEGQQQPGQKLALQAHRALPSTLPSGAALGQLLSSARPGLASREAGGCQWGDQQQPLSCLLCSGKSLGKGLTRVHRPCPCPCASPTLGRDAGDPPAKQGSMLMLGCKAGSAPCVLHVTLTSGVLSCLS